MSAKRIVVTVAVVLGVLFTFLAGYVGARLTAVTADAVDTVSGVASGFSTAEDARLSLVKKFSEAVPAGYEPSKQSSTCDPVNLSCVTVDGSLALSPSVPAADACAVLLAYASATSDPTTLTSGFAPNPQQGTQVQGTSVESLRSMCSDAVSRYQEQTLNNGQAVVTVGGLAATEELKAAFEDPSTVLDFGVVRATYALFPTADGGLEIVTDWR